MGVASVGGASVDAYNYFDGKILSHYLISSGNFSHPVSRRPLSRNECEALDEYMSRHKLGDAGVTHVFDLKSDTSDKSRHHLEALQREASDILQSLFSSTSTSLRPYLPSASQGGGGQVGAQVSGLAGSGVPLLGDGGWTIIDDDEQMFVDMSRQIEEQMWPALPPAPQRSQPAAGRLVKHEYSRSWLVVKQW